MDSNRCTRERITDALHGAGLRGLEAVDMAGWLAGLESGQLPHLSALSLGECQHVMARIDNALDARLLVSEWREARRQAADTPTPEQLRREVMTWLF